MGKLFQSFSKRIVDDFKHKELLPVKVLFFVHMSTILVLYPYLTIHMRELGINVEETAIMSAVTPVVGILMPPLAGMLADKMGNFRVLLALFSVFSGLSALLLLLIPIGRITITYPDQLILGLSCNAQNPFALTLPEMHPCMHTSNISRETSITLQSCGIVCSAYLDENDELAILHAPFYDIQMHNLSKNKTTTIKYTLNPGDAMLPKLIGDIKNHETLKINDKYATAIRKFSRNSYYFPAQTLFNFSCHVPDVPNISQYNNTPLETPFDIGNAPYNCIFATGNQISQEMNRTLTLGLSLSDASEDDLIEEKRQYQVQYIQDNAQIKRTPACLQGYAQNKEHVSIHVHLKNGSDDAKPYKKLDLGTCASRCIATGKRSQFCSNSNTILELDIDLTFWSYLAVRVFISIIGGTAYTMFEGAVIAILREYKADYGLQRMYASLGGMISSPLSGLLIDYASQGKGYTDYRPIFFLYAGLKITSAILMLFINLEFKTAATSVVADVLAVMNIELISLFVAAFLLGSAWGYIESFLFWLLQDLGGTKSLMGLTITVGGILGIPLLAVSGPLIKKMGHANVIFIGFLTYAIRLFGYSIIYNPWLSLIFEALECLTHSLCFTAAITYAARLSTVTTDTTIQGILGGLFYGVGKSAGSLIGGYLIKYFGMRGTFQMFAATTGVTSFVYLAFYHLYMKKRSALVKEEKEIAKEKEAAKSANPMKDLSAIEEAKEPKSRTHLGYENHVQINDNTHTQGTV